MPQLLGSLVLETSNAPGVGTFNLAGAVAGRRTFVQAIGTGRQAYYLAREGTQWEEGYGTVTSGAPNTLSRDAVLENSAGTTAKINFSGAVEVYSALPGRRAITASTDNGSVPFDNRVLSGIGAGIGPADGAALGQIGWRLAQPAVNVGSTQGAVVFSLPSQYDKFRLEWFGMVPTALASAFCRLSSDGGNSYKAGATDYYSTVFGVVGSSSGAASGSADRIEMTYPTTQSNTGHLEFDCVDRQYMSEAMAANSGSVITRLSVCGNMSGFSARPTHILFSTVNAGLQRGRLRLLGAVF